MGNAKNATVKISVDLDFSKKMWKQKLNKKIISILPMKTLFLTAEKKKTGIKNLGI